jgi:hypothetical protein
MRFAPGDRERDRSADPASAVRWNQLNHTPFAADMHVQMDGEGQEVLVAVGCATFRAPDDDGPIRVADEQAPVRFIDEPRGVAARSSIAFESDISPVDVDR